MSKSLRRVVVWEVVLGVEGKGGGCVVTGLVVVKKDEMVGAVRMCSMGRRG